MIPAISTTMTKRITAFSCHGRELATGCRGRIGYAGDLPDNAPAGRRACLSRPASRRTSQITPRQAGEHVDAFAQQDALHTSYGMARSMAICSECKSLTVKSDRCAIEPDAPPLSRASANHRWKRLSGEPVIMHQVRIDLGALPRRERPESTADPPLLRPLRNAKGCPRSGHAVTEKGM